MLKIRSPICVLVGHIDHGKSSILDKVRGTAIVASEPGGITQHISSTKISMDTIKNICGELLKTLKIKLTIPGILFLDTPGHAAFNNLRKRGGNLADIAILVIDINEGVMPQTLECIDILKQYKTPFVVAANKIDLLSGWRKKETTLLKAIKSQSEHTQTRLDKKLYEIVGKLSEQDINSERFDRVSDYTKQAAIIPISAKTGEGLIELLMVLTGLAQRYLEESLQIEVKGPGRGAILEVKEEKGLGVTLDVILYDGVLKVNDQIVIGGLKKPITTKIRALFEPDKKKLKSVKEIYAAAGVKVSAPAIENVVAGMPLKAATKNLEKVKQEVQSEVEEVLIETDKEGVLVKADTLGSLEALIGLLKEKEIRIKKASIGDVSKKDVSEASAEKDPLKKAILCFNVNPIPTKEVKIISHNVIYKIIDDYDLWVQEELKKQEAKELENMVRPSKIQIIPGCVFRQNNPAVVGVAVLGGTLRINAPLMKENGDKASRIKSMQSENKNVQEAEINKEVAIALPGLTVGRQIHEGTVLYSDIPEEDFRKLRKLKKYLNPKEIEILKEIVEIKRKRESLWGV